MFATFSAIALLTLVPAAEPAKPVEPGPVHGGS